MDIVNPEVEAYADAHSTPPPAHLDALAEETRSTLESPGMMVGNLEGRFLEMLVYISGARRVLEIGTFSGYSSLSMAAGLPPDGTIVTCDISEKHAEVACRHIAASPYAGRIEVRVGPAIGTIAELDGPFDLVFIDADKPSNPQYVQWAVRLARPGALIVLDNVVRAGKVIVEDSADAGVQGVRRAIDALAADARLAVTAIQTVGTKGHDGFALALVLPRSAAAR